MKSCSARASATAAKAVATGLVIVLCAAVRVAADDAPRLDGVWTGPTQMVDDESWAFEDFACFLGCPPETFAFARTLFSEPGNFDRSYPELQGVVLRRRADDIVNDLTPGARIRGQSFDPADDPAISCQPYGLVRQALSPLPIEFVRSGDAVVIRYELWGAERVISLERRHIAGRDQSRMGQSIGYYEGEAFIVETSGILADVVAADAHVLHSDELRTIERYTLADGGERLNLELTLIDPVTFVEPLRLRAAWRRAPATQLLPYDCRLIGRRN